MVIDSLKFRLALIKHCKGNKDLAREAGLCEGTITKFCKRDAQATNATIGKLARALGCDPMEIIKV